MKRQRNQIDLELDALPWSKVQWQLREPPRGPEVIRKAIDIAFDTIMEPLAEQYGGHDNDAAHTKIRMAEIRLQGMIVAECARSNMTVIEGEEPDDWASAVVAEGKSSWLLRRHLATAK